MKKILILIYVITSAFGLCGQTYSEDFINDYPDKHRCQAKNRIFEIYSSDEHPTANKFGELIVYITDKHNNYLYDENGNLIRNIKKYTDNYPKEYITEETKYEYNQNGLLINKTIIVQVDSVKDNSKIKYPEDGYGYIQKKHFRYDYPQMTNDGKPLRANIYVTDYGKKFLWKYFSDEEKKELYEVYMRKYSDSYTDGSTEKEKEELYKVYRYNYSNNYTDITIYDKYGNQIGACKETIDKKLISRTTQSGRQTVTEEYNQHGDLIKAGTTHEYYKAYNSSAYNEIEYLSNGEISKRNIKTNASPTTIDVCEIFKYNNLDSIGNWKWKYVTRTTSSDLKGLGSDYDALFNALIADDGNKTTAYYRSILYSNNKEHHKQLLKNRFDNIERKKTLKEEENKHKEGKRQLKKKEQHLKDFAKQNEFIYEATYFGFGKPKLRVEKEFNSLGNGGYTVTKYLKRNGEIVNILKDGDTYTFYIKDKNTFVMIGSPCKLDNVSNITIDVLNGDYNDNNVRVKTLSTSNLELTYIHDLKLLIHQSDNGVKYYSISSKAIKALEEYNKK